MDEHPNPATEVEELREQIRRHNRLYYVLDRQEISDFEYDRLFTRLKELETAHPELATPELQALRILATISLVVMLIFQFVFLYNFVVSVLRGKKAEKNPWKANTLEWTAESPPPHGNWSELPTCYRGPYEYSVPGRDKDYWPQDEPA